MNTDDFAERSMIDDDVPFIADSFCRSYVASGHVAGIRDRFTALLGGPFRAVLRNVSPDTGSNLLSCRVVFPRSEPTEIAGYIVYSPLHGCVIYTLTKPAYYARGVATHLLASMPMTKSTDRRDDRPYLVHCFSTSSGSKACTRLGLRARYSPFLFARILDEMTEAADAEAA